MSVPKSHYFILGNFLEVVAFVADKYLKQGQMLDMSRLRTTVSKELAMLSTDSVSRFCQDGKIPIGISKKKLNAFMKRNINRFLVNPKKLAAIDDFENYLSYMEDIEQDMLF